MNRFVRFESSDRELDRIFGGDLNLFEQARVEREKTREASVIGIGSSDIILLDIPQSVEIGRAHV